MKYEDHEFAAIFPMMDTEDRKRLSESIQINGVMEPVILFEGKTLDGRNRLELAHEQGIEPPVMQYEDLPQDQRGSGPLEFVIARNLDRRHLSAGQRATIAASCLPFFEKQANERQRLAGQEFGRGDSLAQKNAKLSNGESQETGYDPAGESQVRGGKGKAAAHAAKTHHVSQSSVEQAKKLKETKPEEFEKVKQGKKSLNAALRDKTKEEQKKAELEVAYKRITSVCGKALGTVVREGGRLRGRREVLEMAALSDDDMRKVSGLIGGGWNLKKAKAYKMTALTKSHKVVDLLDRTIALRGKLSMEITYRDATFNIDVRQNGA